jgi:predicted kinase
VVCIYDCIEFNERFRSIDVASDVAFLAMDLDFNGRPDLSLALVLGMALRLEDPDLLHLVDFYKCYRAYVRGKVECLNSADGTAPPTAQAESRARARRYYQLALQYAVAGSQPLVLIVMGPVGTGKSTLAQALSDALGWPVVSSDRVRKTQAGVPLYVRGSAEDRAALYTDVRTSDTYEALQDEAVTRAKHRQSTIVDATFSRRTHRDALRKALQAHGVPYVFVEVTASDAVIHARLRARDKADAILSDARLEDYERLQAHYQALDALEEARHVQVDAEPDIETTTRAALQHLISMHAGGGSS